MTKCIYLTLVTTILLYGCSTNSNKVDGDYHPVESFKKRQTLKSEVCDFGVLSNPSQIYHMDSLILLKDSRREKNIFIHNERDYKLRNNVITRGRGRDEFLSCWSIQKQDSLMWVFDAKIGRIIAFRYNDFISDPSPSSVETVTFDAMASKICRVRNGGFVGTSTAGDDLVEFYTQNGTVDSSYTTPSYAFDFPENISNVKKQFYFYSDMKYNSNRDKFVLSYFLNDMFEIYNSDGTLHKRVISPTPYTVLDDLGTDNMDMKQRFAFIALTDDAIYLLYDGASIGEQSSEDYQYTPSQIFVFDYDGNPISHYTLDRYVHTFCVNEKDKIFYAISATNAEVGAEVLKYKF